MSNPINFDQVFLRYNGMLKTDFDEYQIIKSPDGHFTLKSKNFNETTHSLDGAFAETVHNYIEGTKLHDSLKKTEITILELGFGFGVGFLCTVQYLKQHNFKCKLTYIGLEIDRQLVEFGIDEYLSRFIQINNLQFNEKQITFEVENLSVVIYIGDALITIHSLKNYLIDHIYQDAYGPKLDRKLWSVEWFSALKNRAHENTILSTFSSSSGVRKAMIEAGWIVHNRKGFENKKTATWATLHGEMTEEFIEHLKRSPIEAITLKNPGR